MPWSIVRNIELKAVLSHVKLKEVEVLFDIGCGSGFYMRNLQALKPKLVGIGCDKSLAMCEAATEDGIEVENISFSQFKPSRKACCVLAAGLLEFVEDPKSFFRQASLWLKPGGKLVILVPDRNPLVFFYWAYHRLCGNSIFLRSEDYFINEAKEFGFSLQGSSVAPPIAKVISFRLVQNGN